MSNSLRSFIIVVAVVFTFFRLIYRISTSDNDLWSVIQIVLPALVLIVLFVQLTEKKSQKKRKDDW